MCAHVVSAAVPKTPISSGSVNASAPCDDIFSITNPSPTSRVPNSPSGSSFQLPDPRVRVQPPPRPAVPPQVLTARGCCRCWHSSSASGRESTARRTSSSASTARPPTVPGATTPTGAATPSPSTRTGKTPRRACRMESRRGTRRALSTWFGQRPRLEGTLSCRAHTCCLPLGTTPRHAQVSTTASVLAHGVCVAHPSDPVRCRGRAPHRARQSDPGCADGQPGCGGACNHLASRAGRFVDVEGRLPP